MTKNQYTIWNKKEKCLNLQEKFGNYDHFETNPKNNNIINNRQSVYFFVKDVLKGNNYSLLEVGCGPGHFLWALKDFASEVYGLDYSKVMLDLCQEQFDKYNKKVNLNQGTCWELPYKDKSFDVSLQCDVCRHVGGCFGSLSEQIRVSRKYVIFSGPSFENWGLDGVIEKEMSRLLFGINVDIINNKLDKMKINKKITDYYYLDRPNKKDIIKRKILVVEV